MITEITGAMKNMVKFKYITTALVCSLCMTSASACGSPKQENIDQGMQLIQQLQYEESLNFFDAALLDKENAQMSYRGQGLAYMGLTQYEKAVECLEKALTYSDAKLGEIDFDINYYLATAYYKQGELDKAKAVYESITALRPKEKTAYYLKGVVEIEQGDQEAAQADFDRAVEIDPEDYDMRINIFCSCSENGLQELGEGYLQAVLDSKDKKLTDYNRGRMNYYLGDYNNARNSLEKAKDSNGGVDVVRLLGQTYEKLGDNNYAASVYSNFLSTTPDAQIYNQLGLCNLKTGDYESALNAFQSGLAIEGNQLMQVLSFNEIVAYEYLGDFKQATVLMQKYLSAYPDDEKALREYEFLQTR